MQFTLTGHELTNIVWVKLKKKYREFNHVRDLLLGRPYQVPE